MVFSFCVNFLFNFWCFFFKTSVICEAWWYFWVKKHFFFWQIFSFYGPGCSFLYFFGQFFVIFPCKISVLCDAGRSFWVKKDNFLNGKLHFLGGWMLFLCKKRTILWDFLANVGWQRYPTNWRIFSKIKRYIVSNEVREYDSPKLLWVKVEVKS